MIINTPLGPISIQGDDVAIYQVSFVDHSVDDRAASAKETLRCAQQLAEYFAGERTAFDLNLEPKGTVFQQKVWEGLHQIPFGKTSNYEQQAIKMGDIKAIRAVASANGKNPIAIIIPCHRVIGKDGSLTGYAGGLDRKSWLLKHEGAINSEQLEIFGYN